MSTAAQCVLLFMWILSLSLGMWYISKGYPARPPGGAGRFAARLFVEMVYLLLLWKSGALSNLIGGAK